MDPNWACYLSLCWTKYWCINCPDGGISSAVSPNPPTPDRKKKKKNCFCNWKPVRWLNNQECVINKTEEIWDFLVCCWNLLGACWPFKWEAEGRNWILTEPRNGNNMIQVRVIWIREYSGLSGLFWPLCGDREDDVTTLCRGYFYWHCWPLSQTSCCRLYISLWLLTQRLTLIMSPRKQDNFLCFKGHQSLLVLGLRAGWGAVRNSERRDTALTERGVCVGLWPSCSRARSHVTEGRRWSRWRCFDCKGAHPNQWFSLGNLLRWRTKHFGYKLDLGLFAVIGRALKAPGAHLQSVLICRDKKAAAVEVVLLFVVQFWEALLQTGCDSLSLCF